MFVNFEIFPLIIILAFLFELVDSAAGMGFGTALAPILFIMGFDPLEVVPTLLISESVTGILSGYFHNEFENVEFSLTRPFTQATRAMLIVAGMGCMAIFLSIILVYFAIHLPQAFVKGYVSFLVLLMGLIGLFRLKLGKEGKYKPKLLSLFAGLAGFNKGIGGGGFGPVVMMGQLFSGIYEKSATGIVSLAEGFVSAVGACTFFLIQAQGVQVDLLLLPSIFTGGYFAALVAPYIVRSFPNRIWRVLIPSYAFIVGFFLLIKTFLL